jgi:carbon storage regulator
MLVLSRKKGEEIVINGNIRLMIIEVKGNQVKIGIAAPSDVAVDRAEVHNRRAAFAQTATTVAA